MRLLDGDFRAAVFGCVFFFKQGIVFFVEIAHHVVRHVHDGHIAIGSRSGRSACRACIACGFGRIARLTTTSA